MKRDVTHYKDIKMNQCFSALLGEQGRQMHNTIWDYMKAAIEEHCVNEIQLSLESYSYSLQKAFVCIIVCLDPTKIS